MKKLIVFILLSSCFSHWTTTSAEVPKLDSIRQTLAQGPAAEMPARAAETVRAASARQQASITAEVIRAALAMNPAAAPAVVSAIAKAAPEMAAVAAATAAQSQPRQAAEIVKAAAAAAPAKVGKIVTAVCRVIPKEYRNIALAAAQAVPGSVKEILQAIGAAIPELNAGIENALVVYRGNPPAMAVVLDTARFQARENSDSASSPVPRGPTLAPPYIPLSQTSTNVTPSTSGTVPRGGRNYSAP